MIILRGADTVGALDTQWEEEYDEVRCSDVARYREM